MNGTVLLSRSGTSSGFVTAAAPAAVLVVAVVLAGWDALLFFPISLLVVVLGVIIHLMVARRAHTVLIDDEALVVHSPKGTVRYAWSDLLEVGWTGGAWPLFKLPGPVVRPKGGPWDTPGP